MFYYRFLPFFNFLFDYMKLLVHCCKKPNNENYPIPKGEKNSNLNKFEMIALKSRK